jgi:hypothetical protein
MNGKAQFPNTVRNYCALKLAKPMNTVLKGQLTKSVKIDTALIVAKSKKVMYRYSL